MLDDGNVSVCRQGVSTQGVGAVAGLDAAEHEASVLGFCLLDRQGNVQILALHGNGVRWYVYSPRMIDAGAIVQVETPTVPEASHRALAYGAVVQRRTGVWTHVFQGVKLAVVSEDSDVACADPEFASFAFWNVSDTGKTDRLRG